MVFIYGGAFLEGSSRLPIYDGAKLAATGRAVIVSLNYRVGALGFLAGMDDLKGNYGLQDQRLALRWVRDNIAAFGGDPEKVTLFGESAGAMSVGVHLASPGSKDLFHAAIMQSNPYALPYKRLSEAEPIALTLRELLGCTIGGLDCMRQRSFEDVVRHQHGALLQLEGLLEGFTGYLLWAPVLDEQIFTEQPVSAVIDKPVIIGTNRNEGMLFAATSGFASRPAYEAALHLVFPGDVVDKVVTRERYRIRQGDNLVPLSHLLTDYLFTCANRHVMRQAEGPVYGYRFNHVPSFPIWPKVLACAPARGQVCHGDELPFVFSRPVSLNLAASGRVRQHRFSTEEQRLASLIAEFWLSFAESGKPSAGEGPAWRPHNPGGGLQVLGVPVSHAHGVTEHCDFWDTVVYGRRGLIQRLLNR
jgi:carboxylesterase type B